MVSDAHVRLLTPTRYGRQDPSSRGRVGRDEGSDSTRRSAVSPQPRRHVETRGGGGDASHQRGDYPSDRTARSRPLNHRAPCCGARPTTHRYSSSRSTSAQRAISTRYAMLAAQPREDLPRRFGAASFHVRQSLLNPFDSFDPIEQRLVGRRILDHEFSLAVDGQDKRMSGLSEAIEQIGGIALEFAKRPMSWARSSIVSSSNSHRI
jgi:hypothetical protein